MAATPSLSSGRRGRDRGVNSGGGRSHSRPRQFRGGASSSVRGGSVRGGGGGLEGGGGQAPVVDISTLLRTSSSSASGVNGGGANTAITGLTKSTKGTTGTSSSMDDQSAHNRRRRDAVAAAASARRRRSSKMESNLDERSERGESSRGGGSGRRRSDLDERSKRGENSRGGGGGGGGTSRGRSDGRVGEAASAGGGARSRSRPRDWNGDDNRNSNGNGDRNHNHNSGGRAASRPRERGTGDGDGRRGSRSRLRDVTVASWTAGNGNRPAGSSRRPFAFVEKDDVSTLSSRSVEPLSVVVAATMAAAAALDASRRSGSSRPKERRGAEGGHGDKSTGGDDRRRRHSSRPRDRDGGGGKELRGSRGADHKSGGPRDGGGSVRNDHHRRRQRGDDSSVKESIRRLSEKADRNDNSVGSRNSSSRPQKGGDPARDLAAAAAASLAAGRREESKGRDSERNRDQVREPSSTATGGRRSGNPSRPPSEGSSRGGQRHHRRPSSRSPDPDVVARADSNASSSGGGSTVHRGNHHRGEPESPCGAGGLRPVASTVARSRRAVDDGGSHRERGEGRGHEDGRDGGGGGIKARRSRSRGPGNWDQSPGQRSGSSRHQPLSVHSSVGPGGSGRSGGSVRDAPRRGGTPGPTRVRSLPIDNHRRAGTPGPTRGLSPDDVPRRSGTPGPARARSPVDAPRRGGTPGPTRRGRSLDDDHRRARPQSRTKSIVADGPRRGGTPGQTRRGLSPARPRSIVADAPRRGGPPGLTRSGLSPDDDHRRARSQSRPKSVVSGAPLRGGTPGPIHRRSPIAEQKPPHPGHDDDHRGRGRSQSLSRSVIAGDAREPEGSRPREQQQQGRDTPRRGVPSPHRASSRETVRSQRTDVSDRRRGTPGPAARRNGRRHDATSTRSGSPHSQSAGEAARRDMPCPAARRNVGRSDAASTRSGSPYSQAASGATRRGIPGPMARSARSRSPFEEAERDRASRSPNPSDRSQGAADRRGTPGPGQGLSERQYCRETRGRSPMDRAREVLASATKLRSKSPFSRRLKHGADGDSASCHNASDGGGSPDSSACAISLPPARREPHSSEEIRQPLGAGRSVASNHSNRSDQTGHESNNTSAAGSEASRRFLSSEGSAELDPNGCCVRHPYLQLQKPRPGGGWRIMSRTCALCVEEAEERERLGTAAAAARADAALATAIESRDQAARDEANGSATAGAPKEGSSRPHPLERQHSRLNITSRMSLTMPAVQDIVDADASVESSQEEEEEEECSITPSFLESLDDEESLVGSEGSSRRESSQGSADAQSLDLNSLGKPSSSPPTQLTGRLHRQDSSNSGDVASAYHSVHSRHAEERSVVSYKSHKSHKSHKSQRSQRRARPNEVKDEGGEILALEISVLADEGRDSKKAVDMNRVESALRKIKSMEKIAGAASVSRSVTSKSVTSKQPSNKANEPMKQGHKSNATPPPPPPPKVGAKTTNSTGAKQRPPPPPPPPRRNPKNNVKANAASGNSHGGNSTSQNHANNNMNSGATTNQENVYCESMAVLNPHPEPELMGDFPMVEFATAPQQRKFMPQEQPEIMYTQQKLHPLQFTTTPQQQEFVLKEQPEMMFTQQQLQPLPPEQQVPVDVAPQEDKSKEWMKYATGFARRENEASDNEHNKEGGGKKKGRLRGRVPPKHTSNERATVRHVKQMPFTDPFGDFGFYTGLVNEDGRPDGKGSMKYENGVFYEGTWTSGAQDKAAASQYERIRGGFTSWSGKGKSGTKSGMILPWNARKNDAHDATEKMNVRGMEWTDLNGDSGRYTGQVNNDQLPHGNGVMRYDFGLIAEGEWVNGVLKEGPQDRLLGVAAAMNGGQTLAPGMAINSGMSVGPGAGGFASGAVSVLGNGGISIAPGGGGIPVATSMYGGTNPMLAMANQSRQASQHAVIAHQNVMLKGMYGGTGSVNGGAAGSVYAGAMPPHMQTQMSPPTQMPIMMAMQQQSMMQMPQQQPAQLGSKPTISEIKLG